MRGISSPAPRRRSISLAQRSEEHTSELSHDQISYAVFCLKKKKLQLDNAFFVQQNVRTQNLNQHYRSCRELHITLGSDSDSCSGPCRFELAKFSTTDVCST